MINPNQTDNPNDDRFEEDDNLTEAERVSVMQEQADFAAERLQSFAEWRDNLLEQRRGWVNLANWQQFESEQGEA